jgi:hypothetical protein
MPGLLKKVKKRRYIKKTRQELANEYGITTRTLNNRLKKANLYIPDGIIFPKYLRKIYNTFGIPSRKVDSIAKSGSASPVFCPSRSLPLPLFAPPGLPKWGGVRSSMANVSQLGRRKKIVCSKSPNWGGGVS